MSPIRIRSTATLAPRPAAASRAVQAGVRLTAGVLLLAGAFTASPVRAEAAALRTATAQSAASASVYAADGSIEAVRDSRIAAQVAGRITEVLVQAGDRVKAGQVLLRIDPSVASEQLAASRAQVAQAQALLASARSDYERAQRLHAQQYLSDAALDRARTQFRAAEAQAHALQAQALASGAQAGFYTLKAPFAGWVSRVEVTAGDMATPGRPLLTVYDPEALRVSVSVPESVVARIDRRAPAEVAVPGASGPLKTGALEILPGLDAASHTAIVRAPVQGAGLQPGQFARLQLRLDAGARPAAPSPVAAGVLVPRAAVVTRGELTAVYVVDAAGRAGLRQVRLGREQGDQVEVLAGLSAGERVALDPVAAVQR